MVFLLMEVLASLSSGIDLNSKSSTQVTKASQDAFADIVESTRGFLPSYFPTTFKSGRSVEGTVSEKLRPGQLLQLYGLSLHQMHFQMHWALHLYYISSGLQSRTASLHQNGFLIIPQYIKIVFSPRTRILGFYSVNWNPYLKGISPQ